MIDEIEDNQFSWNDLVKIKGHMSINFHPGETGWICGMEKVKSSHLANKYQTEIGKWVYTIEFESGKSITIPEEYLEFLKKENE